VAGIILLASCDILCVMNAQLYEKLQTSKLEDQASA